MSCSFQTSSLTIQSSRVSNTSASALLCFFSSLLSLDYKIKHKILTFSIISICDTNQANYLCLSGETRPPSFHGGPSSRLEAADTADSIIREFDDAESSITSVSQIGRSRRHQGQARMPLHGTRTQQLRSGEFLILIG